MEVTGGEGWRSGVGCMTQCPVAVVAASLGLHGLAALLSSPPPPASAPHTRARVNPLNRPNPKTTPHNPRHHPHPPPANLQPAPTAPTTLTPQGMNRSQLVAAKEESTEMGGYFICNGIERIIRCLVAQRRHYIMALKRGAYRKRGSNYTENATLIR